MQACVPAATLAQLVEQLIRNQQVAGSSPAGGSIKNKGLQVQTCNPLVILCLGGDKMGAKFYEPFPQERKLSEYLQRKR